MMMCIIVAPKVLTMDQDSTVPDAAQVQKGEAVSAPKISGYKHHAFLMNADEFQANCHIPLCVLTALGICS